MPKNFVGFGRNCSRLPRGKRLDPTYGTRPLKRIIQKELQEKLANTILAGRINDGQAVKVSAWEGGLRVV